MENGILLFQHEEFGGIRTLDIDGEQWFVGKDVCKVFGDSNHNRSLSRVDDEDKRTVDLTDSLGRKQTALAINESGLYALLFAMQPQKAHHKSGADEYPIEIRQRIEKLHRFKRWITAEVLPSIRKCAEWIFILDEMYSYIEQALLNLYKIEPKNFTREGSRVE
ncbi:MAG: hypothetical protein J1F28_10210, partial [Oscillospiraceae bacterium]|nr:hypothetical protein [Oscillospiraceae bacterium]